MIVVYLPKKIRELLRKLSAVDLVGLSHQQRLAFWINTQLLHDERKLPPYD